MPRRKMSDLCSISKAARKARSRRLCEPVELRLRRLATCRKRNRYLLRHETPEQREARLALLRTRTASKRENQRYQRRKEERAERRDLEVMFAPFDLWFDLYGVMDEVYIKESRSFNFETSESASGNVDNDPLATALNNREYKVNVNEVKLEGNFSSDGNKSAPEVTSLYLKQEIAEELGTELGAEEVKHDPLQWTDNENAIIPEIKQEIAWFDSELSGANPVEQHIQVPVPCGNQNLSEVPQSLQTSGRPWPYSCDSEQNYIRVITCQVVSDCTYILGDSM